MKKKFDCWTCKYRDEVVGSAHICCKHPSLDKVNDNVVMGLMSILASVQRVPPMIVNSKQLNIKGDEYGIKSGWFNFPFNFDPTWLKNCDGYMEGLK